MTENWCGDPDHFLDFISKDRWPRNSSGLCPLDYSLWNELAESIGWKDIAIKATLIDEIKRSVKNIEKEKNLTFCTIRLCLMQKNKGNHIR